MTRSIDVDFFDADTNECPYAAYEQLREDSPVYYDRQTDMYVLTRYEDVRRVVMDNKTYSNAAGRKRPDRSNEAVLELFRTKGWVLTPPLGVRDEPDHLELRSVWNHALRPSRIRALEPEIREVANSLIDRFIDAGECDFVADFAEKLPFMIILTQMGVDRSEVYKIKRWVDSWCTRLTWAISEEDLLESAREEIDAQHYFQPIFERLREHPEETFMSDLVNTEIPKWGRKLTDNELHAAMLPDTFGGGGETSHGAIAHAIQYLIEHPELQAELRSDPTRIPLFVEELLRLESPSQGLFRTPVKDVEIHGVTIPEGAVINLRFGAANRDPRQFDHPTECQLDRTNSRRHLAFGSGTHACPGATLARTEIRISIEVVLERLGRLWLRSEPGDLHHEFSYVLHALESLPIGFEKA